MVNFRGEFILVWSSDSLAVSKTQTKPLKFEMSHFAVPLLSSQVNTLQMYFHFMAKEVTSGLMDFGGNIPFFLRQLTNAVLTSWVLRG